MRSERLRYAPLTPRDLDAFHALVIDPHVRRYLIDGEVMTREWSASRIAASESLFAEHGVGLWLARHLESDESVGFCGFLVFPELHDAPQLVYALPERYTGVGHATEMARAAIDEARSHEGFETIHAAVDAPNAASLRVLEKLGFERTGELPGALGRTITLQLAGMPGE